MKVRTKGFQLLLKNCAIPFEMDLKKYEMSLDFFLLQFLWLYEHLFAPQSQQLSIAPYLLSEKVFSNLLV